MHDYYYIVTTYQTIKVIFSDRPNRGNNVPLCALRVVKSNAHAVDFVRGC
jgi:hypothetical protein